VTKVIGFLSGKYQYCAWETEEEKNLTRQKAQIGTALIRATMRALMRGVVLLLLFTHQSWASIICGCNHSDESDHACCHTAQHDNPAVEAHRQGSDVHSSSHCAGEEMPAPDTQFDNSPQSAMMCCHSSPQTDAQGVAVTSANPAPVENTPPLIHIGAQTIAAPVSINIHPQRHKRPLYLSFSCWLI